MNKTNKQTNKTIYNPLSSSVNQFNTVYEMKQHDKKTYRIIVPSLESILNALTHTHTHTQNIQNKS